MMGRGVGPGGNLDFARLRLQYCTAAETSMSRSALATKVGEARGVSMSVIKSSESLQAVPQGGGKERAYYEEPCEGQSVTPRVASGLKLGCRTKDGVLYGLWLIL